MLYKYWRVWLKKGLYENMFVIQDIILEECLVGGLIR